MTKSLKDYRNVDLVAFYNKLKPNRPLKCWKAKKDELIRRIKVLEHRKTVNMQARQQGKTVRLRIGRIRALREVGVSLGVSKSMTDEELFTEVAKRNLTVRPEYLS